MTRLQQNKRRCDALRGYPNYQGTPRVDSDWDGMPDDWEKQHGLDPNNANDAIQDQNGDGYTNIEDYINATAPKN